MSVSIEQLLYAAVVGNTGITSLLARDAGGNVAFYDKQLPQQGNAYPAGIFQRISSPRKFVQKAIAPQSQANMGLARFWLIFFGYSAPVLADIDAAVNTMFQTFDAVNTSFVQASYVAYGSRTLVEPQTQPVLYKIEIDVSFWFCDQP